MEDTTKIPEVTIIYSEPADYFPKRTRKKFKLGEYADDAKTAKKGKNN